MNPEERLPGARDPDLPEETGSARDPSHGAEPRARAHDVYAQWLQERERGTGGSLEELFARHPDLREDLQRIARADELIHAGLGPSAEREEAQPATARSPGRQIGDFRLVREIGRGGMGIVFEAEQVSLHRRVALKVLPAQSTLDERARARFWREAEIAGRLHHPGIVAVHQVGEADGVHYLAMDLIEGVPLDAWIERMKQEAFAGRAPAPITDMFTPPVAPAPPTPRPESGNLRSKRSSSAATKSHVESIVKLVCQVADAMEHAHRHGVLHRDIKPSNVLVRPDGTAVLTDFGLAREEGLPHLTQTGEFAGTPHYVSPEQILGKRSIDARADVFALGATLYELLTLQRAFPGKSAHEVLGRILTREPVSPERHNPGLAPDLVTIVLKALEKDPAHRYASMAELAEDLRAFLSYHPIRAVPTPTAVRLLRWARREPLKALLGTVLVVGLPLTGVLLVSLRTRTSEVVAREVEFRETLLEQAFLQLALGDERAAERTLRDALRRFPDSAEALGALALSLLAQDKATEALEVLAVPQGVLDRVRVNVLRELGDPQRAAQIELALDPPTTPLQNYLEASRVLHRKALAPGTDTLVQRRERAKRAVSLLSEAVRGDPERPLYAFALARAAWLAGDAESARTVAAEIARRWPEEATAWYFVGLASKAFDDEAARAAFGRAAELDPELEGALQRQAQVTLERGETEQALDEMTELAERNPREKANQANLAVALRAEGRFEEAARAARRALELDPELVQAWETLAFALYDLGEFEQAGVAFERAIALEPTGARFHIGLGLARERLGDHAGAATALEEALRLDPLSAHAHYNRAFVDLNLRRGDVVAALEHLARAFELDRERPDRDFEREKALHDVGSAFGRILAAGRAAEARGALERILAAAPSSAIIHKCLVALEGELGDARSELAAARRWSEACPESAEAWNHRAWLQVDPAADPGLRDTVDALRAAEEAVRLSRSEEHGPLDTLAWALHWSGEHERALEQGERALELAFEQGAPQEAILALEHALGVFESALASAR